MTTAPRNNAHADARQQLAEKGAFEARIILSRANQRIQVLEYAMESPGRLAGALADVARSEGLGKIFMKARADEAQPLIDTGFEREAVILGYFSGHDAHVLSSFIDPARRESTSRRQENEIFEQVCTAPSRPMLRALEAGSRVLRAEPGDAPELAALYGDVFESYPYPIHSPDYLAETMESHVIYAIVRDASDQLIAAASAETVPGQRSAEMTDFATRPKARCKGLAQHLLSSLEKSMRDVDIPHLYTIARARSAGMTRTFHNAGYEHTGTLVNNCHIAGRFETMHVWCKTL